MAKAPKSTAAILAQVKRIKAAAWKQFEPYKNVSLKGGNIPRNQTPLQRKAVQTYLGAQWRAAHATDTGNALIAKNGQYGKGGDRYAKSWATRIARYGPGGVKPTVFKRSITNVR